mmetsp:Transcript_54677/g.97553  ORF Transcript_54677/g.97553 Transcript_54677/m.97553 type:complete len:569 (-) Transcript_54677:97-1803(-)
MAPHPEDDRTGSPHRVRTKAWQADSNSDKAAHRPVHLSPKAPPRDSLPGALEMEAPDPSDVESLNDEIMPGSVEDSTSEEDEEEEKARHGAQHHKRHGLDLEAQQPWAVASPKAKGDPKLMTPAEKAAEKAAEKERERRELIEQQKTEFRKKVEAARMPIDEKSAMAILAQVKFFSDFEFIMPGILRELSKIAILQHAPEGQVLFRQDDPPVDCYVIVEGRAGVHVREKKTGQTSPRELQPEDVKMLQGSSNGLFCCKGRRNEKVVRVIKDSKRRYCTECLNTFTVDSKLGPVVVELGKKAAFGELGLMERKPRNASIRCLDACQFLVIRKQNFQELLGSAMDVQIYEKKLYFQNNVPGFEIAPEVRIAVGEAGVRKVSRSRHPADQFSAAKKMEGFELLTEGKVASPMIFVIQTGVVSFYRKFSWSRVAQQDQDKTGKDVCFARFEAGQVFASLGTFGLPAAEPFTARVSSPVCTYYMATKDTIPKLPEPVLNELQKHIKDFMRPLLCYSGGFMGTDHYDPEHCKRPLSHHQRNRKQSPPKSPSRSPFFRTPSRGPVRPQMRPQTAW